MLESSFQCKSSPLHHKRRMWSCFSANIDFCYLHSHSSAHLTGLVLTFLLCCSGRLVIYCITDSGCWLLIYRSHERQGNHIGDGNCQHHWAVSHWSVSTGRQEAGLYSPQLSKFVQVCTIAKMGENVIPEIKLQTLAENVPWNSIEPVMRRKLYTVICYCAFFYQSWIFRRFCVWMNINYLNGCRALLPMWLLWPLSGNRGCCMYVQKSQLQYSSLRNLLT